MIRIAVAALVPAVACGAQSVVVPNASANTSSTLVLNNPLRQVNASRTYMMGINASQLTAIPPGSLIVGISMRAGITPNNPAVWPPSDVLYTDYEVTVGRCMPTASWTTNISGNFLGTPVMARDGAMVVQAGAFTNTNPTVPTPNAWGDFYWDFQVPYVYTGGDLGVLFTHPGSTSSTSLWLERTTSDVSVHGQALTAIAFQASTAIGLNYAFCVIRVHYGYGSPSGCPGSGGRSPVLVQSGDVTGGGVIHLATGNAPPNSAALYVAGTGRLSAPLPNGCLLLVVPVASVFVVLDRNGRYDLGLNVPPGVAGTINVQAFVLDNGAPAGFTATNAVEPSAF